MITEQTFTEVAYVRHWEQSAIHLARGLCCRGGRLSCDRRSPSTLTHEGSRDHSCPCWCASQSVPKSMQMVRPRCAYLGLPCWAHERFPSSPSPKPQTGTRGSCALLRGIQSHFQTHALGYISLFLSCFGPKMAKPSKVELLIKSNSSTVVAAHPRP